MKSYTIKNNNIIKKVCTLFVTAIVIFSLLLSAFYICENTKHDCNGGDCAVCFVMNNISDMVKNGKMPADAAISAAIPVLCIFIYIIHLKFMSADTLVSLNVKLSE